ncbi:MAG: DNA adenine methylase [Thermodesulfobacteriota bacterium]
MKQTHLFKELKPDTRAFPKAINVASVPQRSPFRYPGGKTWFVPRFREWMQSKSSKPRLLIEPFVGGGIISLTALFEDLVDEVLMVELDEGISAVWQTVINGNADWLINKILHFDLTRESVTDEISRKTTITKELAFQTILKNRTFHGGILANGSGLIKYGESGKGIHSRWYPQTLAKRLRNLEHISNRLSFRHDDGLKVLNEYSNNQDAIYFIDPPYTAGGKSAGKRLYKYYAIDHENLFSLCEKLNGDFIMTYDNAAEVRALAKKHGFVAKPIAMRNTHHAELTELVIGRDLGWMDGVGRVLEEKVNYKRRTKSPHAPLK